MTDEITKNIGELLQLQEEELKVFISKFKPVVLKKGDYFLKEGEVSRKIGFIVKGSMFCYYNKDGDIVIDEFSLDNEFITDYGSFLTNTPADKDVVCLEKTELLILYYEDLQELYSLNPVFEKTGRLMAEKLFIDWQQKTKSLMLDDAKTRYLKLITKRPDLHQRVPQYLIASYLNVKPETLSRIRKEIAKT